jgi:hypothetical protein
VCVWLWASSHDFLHVVRVHICLPPRPPPPAAVLARSFSRLSDSRLKAGMPYVVSSPEFNRFRTLSAATSETAPVFLQHLAARGPNLRMACTRAHTLTRTHIHTHTHTGIHRTTVTHMHTHTHPHAHHVHARRARKCASDSRAHIHVCMHRHMDAQMHSGTHAHYPQSQYHIHTTCIHTQTTRAHTDACTHSHPPQNIQNETHFAHILGTCARTCGNMQRESEPHMPAQWTINIYMVHTVHNAQHACTHAQCNMHTVHNEQHARRGARMNDCIRS